MTNTRRSIVPLACLFVASCGDKPTAENVRRWTARKDTTKLMAALKHEKAPPEVRCDAALALSGFANAQGVQQAAHASNPVMTDLLACLPSVLKGADAERQPHALTLLSLLLERAEEATREKISPAVGRWIAQDFPRRYRKDILTKFGRSLIGPFVDALKAGAFKDLTRKEREREKGLSFQHLAIAVGTLGDASSRALVAAQIVATFPKGGPLPDNALQALGELKAEGAAELAKLLLDTKGNLEMRRGIPAVLADRRDKTSVARLIPLLRDRTEDVYIRGNIILYMNEVCGDECSVHASLLYAFLKEEFPSTAAANALLKIVGLPALERVLKDMVPTQALSSGEVNKIVNERVAPLGQRAVPVLLKGLKGKNWIGKLIAIRALAKIGGSEGVQAVMRLRGEKLRPATWKEETSIGEEAARAVRDAQQAATKPSARRR